MVLASLGEGTPPTAPRGAPSLTPGNGADVQERAVHAWREGVPGPTGTR